MYKINEYLKTGVIPAGNELPCDGKMHIFNCDGRYHFRFNPDGLTNEDARFFFLRLSLTARELMNSFLDDGLVLQTTGHIGTDEVKAWFQSQFNPKYLAFEGFGNVVSEEVIA